MGPAGRLVKTTIWTPVETASGIKKNGRPDEELLADNVAERICPKYGDHGHRSGNEQWPTSTPFERGMGFQAAPDLDRDDDKDHQAMQACTFQPWSNEILRLIGSHNLFATPSAAQLADKE